MDRGIRHSLYDLPILERAHAGMGTQSGSKNSSPERRQPVGADPDSLQGHQQGVAGRHPDRPGKHPPGPQSQDQAVRVRRKHPGSNRRTGISVVSHAAHPIARKIQATTTAEWISSTASVRRSRSMRTYHTDFAQVEVDQQQVNLTRFSLFFPEKRDFFIENAGNFGFGGGGGGTGRNTGGGSSTGTSGNLSPFYSRRIGLSAAGTPIPIIGGTRLSGKGGRRLRRGFSGDENRQAGGARRVGHCAVDDAIEQLRRGARAAESFEEFVCWRPFHQPQLDLSRTTTTASMGRCLLRTGQMAVQWLSPPERHARQRRARIRQGSWRRLAGRRAVPCPRSTTRFSSISIPRSDSSAAAISRNTRAISPGHRNYAGARRFEISISAPASTTTKTGAARSRPEPRNELRHRVREQRVHQLQHQSDVRSAGRGHADRSR